MMPKRTLLLGTTLLVSIALLGFGSAALERAAGSHTGAEAPMFEVDPLWPQPLPNHWLLGNVVGVGVDSRDHVFIIHRRQSFNERTEISAATDPPTGSCCYPAPNVLEFDPEGNLVNSWGGPDPRYTWPESNHGITVDPKDNIWIGGNGSGDAHVLKFTRDGEFLMEIGDPSLVRDDDGQVIEQRERDSGSMERFGRVAKISFDATGDEAYIADGYRNRRVVVIDANTGEFKRFWGAYGNMPDDTDIGPYDPSAPPAQQFRTPVHCADPSNDGLVYVCDRPNDRIQVFRADGTFVTEKLIAPETLGDGSTWDIAFSRDAEQRFMYVADGKNEKIYVMERASLEVLTTFGDGGRQPGQFFAVHSLATDSKGNLYTTETYEGKRIQKFVYKGLGPVTVMDQGTVWPRRSD
jgi:DNA-binding beta-propeller fold protein YncE